MTQAKHYFRQCLSLLLLAGLLSACASIEVKDGHWANETEESGPADKVIAVSPVSGAITQRTITPMSAREMEQSAIGMPSPEKEELLLYAANDYLDLSDLVKTSELLAQINTETLPEKLRLRHQVLLAALLVETDKPDQARNILATIREKPTRDPVFNSLLLLVQAELAELDGEFLKALTLLNRRADYISLSQEPGNNQRIWQLTRRQDLQVLEQARLDATDWTVLGWIELGIIDKKRGQIPPTQLQQAMTLWGSAYANHPASSISLNQAGTIASVPINEQLAQNQARIALLLPLTSAYSEIAQTIQDGFIAAATANNQPVQVYDTGADNTQMSYQYQLAVSQGAQLIVGPLGKTAANYLINTVDVTRPTLLLGTVTPDLGQARLPAQAYTFALDPEHEAESIARRAYQRGFNRAAILYPGSNRGKRMNTAFVKTWNQLGGIVAASIAYDPDIYEANDTIDQLLTSASVSPDVIFMAANAQQGRLLNQVLKKHKPGTPVFASSSIFTGESDPTSDFVLDNIMFTDMPWMIEDFSNARFRRQQLSPDEPLANSSLSRYFAYGVDAYSLSTQLQQFIQQPGAMLGGVTGDIQLHANRFVTTRPLVQFVEGRPVPIY